MILILGMAVASLLHRSKSPVKLALKEGQVVRIIGRGGAGRRPILKSTLKTVVLGEAVPGSRNVRFGVGQSASIQAADRHGLIHLRVNVLAHNEEQTCIVVRPEGPIRLTDRRSDSRRLDLAHEIAFVNGIESWVMNLSAGGARVCIPETEELRTGDFVKISLPQGLGATEGWVLESVPGPGADHALRIQFVAPLKRLAQSAS